MQTLLVQKYRFSHLRSCAIPRAPGTKFTGFTSTKVLILTPEELCASNYKKRFDNWLEPDPEHPTPPFHYATHYSSAAAVTYYLIRLEPLTSVHVQV